MNVDVSEMQECQIFYWIWWNTYIFPNPLVVDFFCKILKERENGQTHKKRQVKN